MSRGDGIWEDDLIHVTDRFVARIVETLERTYIHAPPSEASAPCTTLLKLSPAFEREGRLGWLSHLPAGFGALCDDDAGPERSPLLLIEDGRELGPGHEAHETIRNLGRGCYSFWKGELYFSSSDGSDPNRNGRVYAVRRIE